MQTINERSTPDLVNLMEWNRFAEEKKTLLEALTILNNRHREAVSSIERERDEARKQLNRTLDELYEEQQNHGKTKGNLTERQIERDVWCLKYSKVFSENKAMREAIKEAHEALEACMEDSVELLAEHNWWQDEPRCSYQLRYEENKQRIENAKIATAKLKTFIQ